MRNLQSNSIYWLAGLLEGEGWFGVGKGKYPTIILDMCDLDIVQNARNITDANVKIQIREESDRKTLYRIQLTGQKAVEWMMTLYVLMGNRRKEKIREILQVWKGYEFIDRTTRAKKMLQTRSVNKIVELIAMSRNISLEEAKQIYEASLTSNWGKDDGTIQ